MNNQFKQRIENLKLQHNLEEYYIEVTNLINENFGSYERNELFEVLNTVMKTIDLTLEQKIQVVNNIIEEAKNQLAHIVNNIKPPVSQIVSQRKGKPTLKWKPPIGATII